MANKKVLGSLDTNILLRLILGDVTDQVNVAERLLDTNGVYHVADIVLFELVFVLEKVYGFTREDTVESLKSIIRHNQINCNRKVFELALTAYRNQSSLSIVDAALPIYAEYSDALPLYTFDKALAASSDNTTLLK